MPQNQFDDDSMAGATLLRRLQTNPNVIPPQQQPDLTPQQKLAALLKQPQR